MIDKKHANNLFFRLLNIGKPMHLLDFDYTGGFSQLLLDASETIKKQQEELESLRGELERTRNELEEARAAMQTFLK